MSKWSYLSAIERFESGYIIDPVSGCWLWIRSLDNDGYAHFKVNGKQVLVHRFSYEHFKGPIPVGLTIDHLCRVHNCVNADHLEAVTQRENALRGQTLNAANIAKTHCPRGHEYTDDNIIWNTTNKGRTRGRQCKLCTYAKARAKWPEIRERVNAYRRRVWTERRQSTEIQ